ncbi:hypothetical protein NQ315_006253 [Exocentrus adspersus]|uniref:Alpha-mannosidase n=1 Tax=Exocentrus adspersus TaxID=1586481 RepID=A0AAV8W057_9CUCU|nr:hypothetical protein NQ315_006253 [Exocentrus adspersus]
MWLKAIPLVALYASAVFAKPFIDEEPHCAGFDACHPVVQDGINVHLVPHSHDDVGWLQTVDQYFYQKVQYIISNVITYLQENPDRRFIQVETAYFHQWWKLQNNATKSQVIELINTGRLEIANGAWSMNDEAAVHYQSTTDQYTLGLRFLEDVLGKCARPKVGWQIDPFGHSREQASLLSQMGMDAFFFSRIDYREMKKRRAEKTMDLLWRGSANLGYDSNIFTSVLYDHYNAPPQFCFDVDCNDPPIVTDNQSAEYNWEERVQLFTSYIEAVAGCYPTNNILVTIGGDMKWRNAEKVFVNLDRLIEGFKKFKPQISGKNINLIYSTPACYTKAVRDYIVAKEIKLDVVTEDFFPYADGEKTVWAGYFTSRPTSKRLERFANNLHQVSKQVTALGGKPYGAVAKLSRALGVMQHHDAITGTEKTAVEKDYHRSIVTGMNEAIEEISDSFSSILGAPNPLNLTSCFLSNVSVCSESDSDQFNVLVYNPLARNASHYIQIPVRDGTWKVTDPTGEEIATQLTDTVRNLDYITNNTKQKILPKVLFFKAEYLPALGYRVYSFQRTDNVGVPVQEDPVSEDQIGFKDRYVNFNATTKLLKSITLNGLTLGVTQKLMFYRSAKDGSGAYIFRPDPDVSHAVEFGDPVTTVLVNDGDLVKEVRQVWRDWATQVVRVYKDEDFIEFDWMVGPINSTSATLYNLEDTIGKEVISQYSTDLTTNGVFYTDSNGREMIYRKKNYRPTYNYTDKAPQAGNYYPVNTKILVKDETYEFAVLTDRSEGGSSLASGEVELMLHRVCSNDDNRGVGEALNETEYNKPVVVRGSHFVTLGKSANGNGGRTMAAVERDIAQRKHLQPWVFYTAEDLAVKEQSFLNKELPPNVHLLTLESWGGGNSLLIRLEHILENDEDPNLSREVTVDLKDLFKTIKINSMVEYALAGITPLEESEKLSWPQVEDDTDPSSPLSRANKLARDPSDLKITLAPMQIRTFVADIEIQDGIRN